MGRIVFVAAMIGLGLGAVPAEDQYIQALKGKGYLAVDGTRVFVAPPSGDDILWDHSRVDATIRVRNGPKAGWYLTADEEGRVYLSETPEAGSHWSTTRISDLYASTLVNRIGGENRPLVLADKPSILEVGPGRQRRVFELRLAGSSERSRGDFRFTPRIESPPRAGSSGFRRPSK